MEGTPIRNEARVNPKAAEKTVTLPKSVADIQRWKLEKLMRNPDKPAFIPAPKKEWKPKAAPEFVRDVMGSSAGAGSGEFHVYRHIRRREYNRQEYLDKQEKRAKLDEEYAKKREENQKAANEATAKKREKRLRRKKKLQALKQNAKKNASDKARPDSASEKDVDSSGETVPSENTVSVDTNSLDKDDN